MAATIKVFSGVDLVVDGEQAEGSGSMLTPVQETELTGGDRRVKRRIVVPAGEDLAVWEWADTNGFDYFELTVRGGGFLRMAYQVQSVTSEEDQTPNGNPVWNHRSLSCVAPAAFDSDRCLMHTSDTTTVGDTAGEPSLWASGSAEDGVIAKVMLRNEDVDEDVTVDLYVVGE